MLPATRSPGGTVGVGGVAQARPRPGLERDGGEFAVVPADTPARPSHGGSRLHRLPLGRDTSTGARLSVEMVQGNLKSPEDMAQAVEGCDAVVHCAIGTAYGQRREIFAVTVGG